jgi:hypothetical protein
LTAAAVHHPRLLPAAPEAQQMDSLLGSLPSCRYAAELLPPPLLPLLPPLLLLLSLDQQRKHTLRVIQYQ